MVGKKLHTSSVRNMWVNTVHFMFTPSRPLETFVIIVNGYAVFCVILKNNNPLVRHWEVCMSWREICSSICQGYLRICFISLFFLTEHYSFLEKFRRLDIRMDGCEIQWQYFKLQINK